MAIHRTRKRIAGTLLVIAVSAGLGPTAAQGALGLKSTLGGGYSQDHNSRKQVRACDTAGDGHPVYAQYNVNGSGTTRAVYDNNGANNGCVSSGSYSSLVYRHRIAVEYAGWPDTYGDWMYPS